MNERQRADELARAIDELIHGAREPRPAQADDHELKSLIQVAQSRLAAGRETQVAEAQSSVWERLLDRLEGRPQARREVGQDIVSDDAMRQTVVARRQMSEAILDLAEQHRDEVWKRVQQRIGRGKGRPPRSSGGADGSNEGRLGARLLSTGDSDLESILFDQPNLRDLAERESNTDQRRLQERMRGDPGRRSPPANFGAISAEPRAGSWSHSAFIGGLILLAAAAIGPLPSTGFADHPLVRAVGFAAEHVGVAEAQAPNPTGAQTLVTSQPANAADASQQLGVAVVAPDSVLRMTKTSERFFPAGLMSDGAGLFVLTYGGAETSVTVYQEAAGGAALSVPPGRAIDARVGNSPATYFEGSWSASEATLVWVPDSTQTLVFDHNGVRTTVEYAGAPIDFTAFAAAAATFLS